MKNLICLIMFLAFNSEASTEIWLQLDGEELRYSECTLIWSSTTQNQAGNSYTYVDTQCLGAPIGGPSTSIPEARATLYINARAYHCRLANFTFVTVPVNDMVLYMDCRNDLIFKGGLN